MDHDVQKLRSPAESLPGNVAEVLVGGNRGVHDEHSTRSAKESKVYNSLQVVAWNAGGQAGQCREFRSMVGFIEAW